ncbi:MAG: hypothetical protein ACRDPH_04810 [Marmoricola sp.]
MKNIMKSRVTAVGVGAALLVGVGGMGVATASGLITSGQIKDHTIHAQDMHQNSVGWHQIKSGSVSMSKVGQNVKNYIDSKAGAHGVKGDDGESAFDLWTAKGNTGTPDDFLASLKGQKGQQGEKGDTGPAGHAGPAGPSGTSGYEVVGNQYSSKTGPQVMVVSCYGKAAVGGGIKASKPGDVTVNSSYPSDTTLVPGSKSWPNNGAGTWYSATWTINYTNTGTGSVQGLVTCIDMPTQPSS